MEIEFESFCWGLPKISFQTSLKAVMMFLLEPCVQSKHSIHSKMRFRFTWFRKNPGWRLVEKVCVVFWWWKACADWACETSELVNFFRRHSNVSEPTCQKLNNYDESPITIAGVFLNKNLPPQLQWILLVFSPIQLVESPFRPRLRRPRRALRRWSRTAKRRGTAGSAEAAEFCVGCLWDDPKKRDQGPWTWAMEIWGAPTSINPAYQ